jgi:hypothetical protein
MFYFEIAVASHMVCSFCSQFSPHPLVGTSFLGTLVMLYFYVNHFHFLKASSGNLKTSILAEDEDIVCTDSLL